MKRILLAWPPGGGKMLFFLLMILSIGCFDGDRGVLTELLPLDAPAAPALIPDPGVRGEIAAGTGSELVVSPIPAAMKDRLFPNFEANVDFLEKLLSPQGPGVSETYLKVFCDRDVDPRVFYDKYINAEGIAIIAPSYSTSTSGVRDEFLYMTREIILTMTSERPALRRVLSPGEFRYVLIGGGEVRDRTLPKELDVLARYAGFFGGVRDGVASIGGVAPSFDPDTRSWSEVLMTMVVTHEFAHAIDYAFRENPHLFPNWNRRLTRLYEAALVKAERGEGFFREGDTPLQNSGEYWAYAASEWFTRTHGGTPDDDWGRDWMLEWDPGLYRLLDDVFPAVDLPWEYVIVGEE